VYACRFTQVTDLAATRMFVGLTTLTGATTMVATANPSAASANFIGVGFNTGDSTNLRVMWKDGSTYGDADIASGAARASGANLYDLYIYAFPNDSRIYLTLYNVYSQTVAVAETAYSTNIPSNTSFMGPVCLVGAASAGVVAIGMCRTVIITPY